MARDVVHDILGLNLAPAVKRALHESRLKRSWTVCRWVELNTLSIPEQRFVPLWNVSLGVELYNHTASYWACAKHLSRLDRYFRTHTHVRTRAMDIHLLKSLPVHHESIEGSLD